MCWQALKQNNTTNAIEQLNKVKKYFEKQQRDRENKHTVIEKLNHDYIKSTNNKMVNYIDDFIDILIKNLGDKIKLDNNTIHLRDTTYIVTNDYMGNDISTPIIILSSENKIISTLNHSFFKTNVIYYHDKLNNVFVYYNTLTKNYIGYSKDNFKC